MIEHIFSNHKTYDIKFYSRAQTITNGVLSEPTYTLYKTIKGVYYKTGGAKTVISEQYQKELSAVILVNPADISLSSILESSKIVVDTQGDYVLLYADDVAGQGKVTQLFCKDFK